MRYLVFSSRNQKEIIRDPLNIMFGIGFPIIILFIFSAIQKNIPDNNVFNIDTLAPGVAVFGLSFISLFSGILIAKDRTSSFLMRLFASPLRASDYIIGYTLPLLPIGIIQSVICFVFSIILGLSFNLNTLIAILVLIPTSLIFIGIGLLSGSLFNEKQVGGVCGALLTNVTAWLSGAWFELSLIGGGYEKVAYLLPFAHAVDATRAAIIGDYKDIFPHLWWVISYALIFMGIAIYVFNKKMNGKNV